MQYILYNQLLCLCTVPGGSCDWLILRLAVLWLAGFTLTVICVLVGLMAHAFRPLLDPCHSLSSAPSIRPFIHLFSYPPTTGSYSGILSWHVPLLKKIRVALISAKSYSVVDGWLDVALWFLKRFYQIFQSSKTFESSINQSIHFLSKLRKKDKT